MAFLFFSAFAAFFSLSLASLGSFLSCLPSDVEVHLPASQQYANLSSLSFRSDSAEPIAIALPNDERGVKGVVRCAARNTLNLCVRSGGHSLVGNSLCNGLLLDVGRLRKVTLKGDIAVIGAGVTMGELLWGIWKGGKRWVAAGVCPGVGVGGYIFGGGHGPYEGRLGMACDSLTKVRVVNKDGRILVATKNKHRDLFWALCGAGGGHLGVVTEFEMETASSKPFDNAVVFRFRWPQKRIGALIEKWTRYDEEGGDVWFRMEMGLEKSGEIGMFGYGACYNVNCESECMKKLKKARFFKTKGRETILLEKAKNALDVHAFFGPDGDWARKRAKRLRPALIEKRYVDAGQANGRLYQSTFLTFGNKRPGKEFWQKYGDFCAQPGRESIPWVVCEMNLFNNAIDKIRDNAFAHRGAEVITHYIIGGGEDAEKLEAYTWMKKHFAPYTTGVYVNYPELELGQKEYPKKYWGKSLGRLRELKTRYDPDLFFLHPQPIPTVEMWRRQKNVQD